MPESKVDVRKEGRKRRDEREKPTVTPRKEKTRSRKDSSSSSQATTLRCCCCAWPAQSCSSPLPPTRRLPNVLCSTKCIFSPSSSPVLSFPSCTSPMLRQLFFGFLLLVFPPALFRRQQQRQRRQLLCKLLSIVPYSPLSFSPPSPHSKLPAMIAFFLLHFFSFLAAACSLLT